MKTFWTWIKNNADGWLAAWDLAPRGVLLARDGDLVRFAVVARRRRGKIDVEFAGEAAPEKLRQHPALRRSLSFPRVLFTRFGAALPLEKGIVQEWSSPLADRRKIRKVLPFEMRSRLPFPVEEAVFDLCSGKAPRQGEPAWQVAALFREAVRAEADFWAALGISLDFLEWEGNLQAQAMKELCAGKTGLQAWANHFGQFTHLTVVESGEIVSQKLFVEPTVEESQKRIRLAIHGLELKGFSSEVAHFDGKPEELDFSFPANWPARQQWLFGGLALRAVSPVFEGMNFLRQDEKWRVAKEWILQKGPALSVALLIALVANQLAQGVEKAQLRRTLAGLREKEASAVAQIAQKTGLSEAEVRRKKGGGFFPEKSSVLGTLVQAAEQLSRATGPSYRGRLLEIGADHLKLEGETDSFAEVQKIQDRLQEAPSLKQVQLVSSHQEDGRVFFQLSAEREQHHVE